MKTSRQIAIADNLWDAYERMAEEMGTDPDALVNQAMHVFARLSGFAVPGALERGAESRGPTEVASSAEVVLLPEVPPPPSERHAVAEHVLETAARLGQDVGERTPPDAVAPPPPPAPCKPGGTVLFLVGADGIETPVAKDRYVIGRGRHCDLVIDSGKVSREHAVVFRSPDGDWFIEDLGSSNGTWHRRERIGRRRIDDGDEYFVSVERIRCALR